jgi:hypothetical protein
MTPAIFKRSSSTDRADRRFSFDRLDEKGYGRSANNPLRPAYKLPCPLREHADSQQLTAAPESLVKNNEILRNKQM